MTARAGSARALITGGAGFIGSHLAEALLAGGAGGVAVGSFPTGRRESRAAVPGLPRPPPGAGSVAAGGRGGKSGRRAPRHRRVGIGRPRAV